MSDAVIMGNRRLWQALEEREILYTKTDLSEADGMRLGELEGIVGEEDGYTADSDAAILLQGLDIPDALHKRTMAELQGGQKVRVLLAQALFGNPECCCWTSRPTTLTSTPSTGFSDFLLRYEGTLIVISHDRHFLNAVCTHIADIDYETIITYTGGYDDMVLAKTQIRARIEAENAQREKKIAQLNDFIARFSAGTRASQVSSRRKEVERLQTTDLARSNIQRPYIRFKMSRPSGGTVLEFDAFAKAQGGRRSSPASRGSSTGGKRSCSSAATARARPRCSRPSCPMRRAFRLHGRSRFRHAEVGTRGVDRLFSAGPHRRHREGLDGGRVAAPVRARSAASGHPGLLGQMLFSGEEGLKPTEALSGGETARLLFCRIMLQKPNVLVLDEPTNHLDLEAINALNVALQEFEGTVFLVTHDQDLIEEVGTRVWHFERGEIRDFKGPYEEYAASLPA